MPARGRGRSGAGGPGGFVARRLAALGLFNTRRAALLVLVVCALAFSVAVPLRTYITQRSEVTVQEQRQEQLRKQVERLERRQAQLSDPTQVEAEARHRLRYVMPGETPYIVQLPGDRGEGGGESTEPPRAPGRAWYEELWSDVTGG
ncbi:MAG: septum formation initiator family protein [Pseudonocardiaceae bacterium]|nr:septum formation initiator family protein [Pseudonocardiaceae bacterium]